MDGDYWRSVIIAVAIAAGALTAILVGIGALVFAAWKRMVRKRQVPPPEPRPRG